MGTMPKDFVTLLSHCITRCRLTGDRRSSILERIRNLYLFIKPYYTKPCILNPWVSNLFFFGWEREEGLVRRCHGISDFAFLFQHALMALLLSLKVRPPPVQNLVFFEHLLVNVFDINLSLSSSFLILRISMEEANGCLLYTSPSPRDA